MGKCVPIQDFVRDGQLGFARILTLLVLAHIHLRIGRHIIASRNIEVPADSRLNHLRDLTHVCVIIRVLSEGVCNGQSWFRLLFAQ